MVLIQLEHKEKYYTGKTPEREPYNAGLSQYELKMPLIILDGGTNIGGMSLLSQYVH